MTQDLNKHKICYYELHIAQQLTDFVMITSVFLYVLLSEVKTFVITYIIETAKQTVQINFEIKAQFFDKFHFYFLLNGQLMCNS